MKRLALTLLVSLAIGSAAGVAQDAVQQARDEGKEFGKAKRADLKAPSQAQLGEVPGYAGTDLQQSTYFDDPDRLATDGAVQATGNEAFQTVTDQGHTRPTFTNSEILDTTERATNIADNPDTYLGGEQLGGSSGTCVPLPPGAGQKGYYEATCNQGSKLTETPQTCAGRMNAVVVNTLRYFYYGVPANQTSYGFASTTVLNAKVSAGICRVEPVSRQICDAQVELGAGGTNVAAYLSFCRSRVRGNAQQYSCASEIPQGEIPDHRNTAAGTTYLKKEGSSSVTVTRLEGTCPALLADTSCVAQGPEVCTEGPETRTIDGVPVTQACWAWSRPFVCQRITPANDCTALEANKQCSFLREECLDDPRSGACKVAQRVFSCPLPDEQASGDKQYICGNDVYCMNGNCEPIEREASTEFKDALVALNALGQAGKEFDENELTVFSGERDTCSKKIFGASNCCSGKGVPLLTPWLCSSAEKQLDEKDDKGLCYKVGSYCSDSILGVCVTSKDAYCCFGSKISRILQVQGRQQIGKAWAKPKNEQCKGFTIAEFQLLDLSKMDFTEVYAEFTEAAKLPDEVQTMTDIQNKIQAYYDLHRGQ
ncbi:conjugal transfer protein TraN [Sphingomonas xinjiangensis]|uniref:Conjugal transfer mating pair stabilization protein TraN n=1 Tax=Sphingomonas xinjiangensis TaxID=643568 RepID=A0A840YIR2_9SPHN|nr:conjugal transfer mating pair stabilization protein TraN [Sphingomonas xinjiangensis]